MGTQCPPLQPHPNPPQRGGNKRLDSGDLRSPDPCQGAEPPLKPRGGGPFETQGRGPLDFGFLRAKPLVWGSGTEGPRNTILLPHLKGRVGVGYQLHHFRRVWVRSTR